MIVAAASLDRSRVATRARRDQTKNARDGKHVRHSFPSFAAISVLARFAPARWPAEQLERCDGRLLLDLFHQALPRRFIRSPAQEFGAVAEATAGEMIVSNFDD